MADQGKKEEKDENLQFDKADFSDASATGPANCTLCQQKLSSAYYEAGGQLLCPPCRERWALQQADGRGLNRFLKATLVGTVAAVAGALLYFGVAALTGYEFGLIAIVVGLMVGFGVRWGAEARGGWIYQGLAMFLTYSAIVSTYTPHLLKAIKEQAVTQELSEVLPAENGEEATDIVLEQSGVESMEIPVEGQDPVPQEIPLTALLFGYGLLFAFSFIAPFMGGFQNIMGIIIIGIGLYEAWQINKPVVIKGPFTVGQTPTVPPPETPS